MTKTETVRKQERYLQVILVAVFAASFGAVLLERARISEELAEAQDIKPLPLGQEVRGEYAERSPGIVEYHDIVSATQVVLNQTIDALLQGRDARQFPIDAVYQNLLTARAPSSFQALHLALVSLAREARKLHQADAYKLYRERQILYQTYPWLVNVSAP